MDPVVLMLLSMLGCGFCFGIRFAPVLDAYYGSGLTEDERKKYGLPSDATRIAIGGKPGQNMETV